jgi:hypothetical protein
VRVRCKRCGESFPVDSTQQSEEVYARQSERRRGRDADLFAGVASAGAECPSTPLTGERNESSVLFSLAALSKQAPAPPAAKVTESSALIDIRALVSATPRRDAAASRADDIMNLSAGGAYTQLFAPPVTYAPADNDEVPHRSQRPIVIAATALVVVALLGVAAFIGVRSRSTAAVATAVTAASTTSASADVPSFAGTAPSDTVAVATSDAPPAPSAPPAAVTPARTSTPSSIATPARSAPHADSTARTGTQVATASTATVATRCCPGESEMACHMRLSAGAACGAEPPGSAVTPPPFDRLAASRALGINVTSCKRGEGPTGPGHVKVTFQPGGSVSAVDVDAPYAGTATGACVAQRYRGASVPPFAGGPLSVGKTFVIQ